MARQFFSAIWLRDAIGPYGRAAAVVFGQMAAVAFGRFGVNWPLGHLARWPFLPNGPKATAAESPKTTTARMPQGLKGAPAESPKTTTVTKPGHRQYATKHVARLPRSGFVI